MKKHVKTPNKNKMTKEAKISLYVREFIENSDKYDKLDKELVKIQRDFDEKIEDMREQLDGIDQLIVDRQTKLEELGVSKDLLIDACGYHGQKREYAAMAYLKTLI